MIGCTRNTFIPPNTSMIRMRRAAFIIPILVTVTLLLIHGCSAVPRDKYQKAEKRNVLVIAYSAG